MINFFVELHLNFEMGSMFIIFQCISARFPTLYTAVADGDGEKMKNKNTRVENFNLMVYLYFSTGEN